MTQTRSYATRKTEMRDKVVCKWGLEWEITSAAERLSAPFVLL